MKRTLLYIGATLLVAYSHCAQFTPGLAAALVANCTTATSHAGPVHLYCLPEDPSAEEPLCFFRPSDRAAYDQYPERMAGWFTRIGAYATLPDASCTPVAGAELPSEITCVAPDSSSAEMACFDLPSVYCSSSRLGTNTRACFASTAALTEFIIERRRKELSGWQAFLAESSEKLPECAQSAAQIIEGSHPEICPREEDLLHAEKILDRFKPEICPRKKERLHDYIARMMCTISIEKPDMRDQLRVDEFLSERGRFWSVSWSIRRYLLATMIELELIKPNDTLTVSGLTPLDHAAQNEDEEMIFFLWSKGARHANNHETLGYVRMDIMMKSPDERSLAILKEMADTGIEFEWGAFNWAKDLAPELVLKKIYIFLRARPHLKMSPSKCISQRFANMFPESTPGERALKNYLLQHADWWNCAEF